MTLGSTVTLDPSYPRHGKTVAPVSLISDWDTAIDAGGVAVQDAATITDPTSSITAATRHLLRREEGTLLTLRLAYDKTLTSITAPKVKVFGRISADRNGGTAGAWELLPNKNGDLQTTITPASTDVVSGALAYSTVNLTNHAIDVQGCDELLIGVEVALAGSTGTAATAFLQARMI